MPPRWAMVKLRGAIRRIQNASQASAGRPLPCLTMSSNGAIRFAAAAASAVAITAFGAGAPDFQPAMSIVVAATPMAGAKGDFWLSHLPPPTDFSSLVAGD